MDGTSLNERVKSSNTCNTHSKLSDSRGSEARLRVLVRRRFLSLARYTHFFLSTRPAVHIFGGGGGGGYAVKFSERSVGPFFLSPPFY